MLAAVVLTAVVVAGIAWGVRAAPADVDVQQAYFVTAQPVGADLNLTAALFVTNEGASESDDVTVTVFVVPQSSGLATYTTKVHVGRIDARTTHEVQVPLTVPGYNQSRSYRIDFLVFEDGLLTQRGQGHLGWGGHHYADASMEDAASGKAAGEAMSATAPVFERVR